jgi:hypothetical protein
MATPASYYISLIQYFLTFLELEGVFYELQTTIFINLLKPSGNFTYHQV